MNGKQLLLYLLFKGDSSSAKKAAAETKTAVDGVTAATQSSTSATEKGSAAALKDANARGKAAAAAQKQAEAFKKVRDETHRLANPSGSSPDPSETTLPGADPQQIEAMRAAYVPMFAAQQAYQSELAKIAEAEKLSALSASEADDARGRARMSFDHMSERIQRADALMRGNARTMKLQGHEARVLSYQITDTFQSFALGMSPLQILLQQGPQVVDVFGGIGNTMRYMRQGLTGMRVLLGTTSAAALAGASAWDQYLKSMKSIEGASLGLGQGIAITPGQLELDARAAAEAGGISTGRANDLAAQLVGSGQIGGDNIKGIVEIARDFAATNQLKMDEVGAELVKTFSKPGKAAEELYTQYRLLEAQDVSRIKRLEDQNRKYEAQALLLERLKDRLLDADDAKTALGRTWEGAGRGLSNLWSGTGGLIADVTGTHEVPLDEQIRLLEAQLERAQDAPSRRRSSGTEARLQAQLDALYSQRDERDAEGTAREARARGTLALSYADRAPANAQVLQERVLRDQIAGMRAGLDAPDLSETQRAGLNRAIEGQSAALDALSNRQERANELARLDLQIAIERNPLRRAELLAEKARQQAAEKGLSLDERRLAGDRARREVLNEVIGATASQAAGMAEEAEARGRLNALQAAGVVSAADAATWMERELALRPLIAAAANAEGDEKAELEAEIQKLRGAYDDLTAARKREAAQTAGRATDDRIAQLQLEASLIGQSNEARNRALALAEAQRSIRDMGLSPDSQEAADLLNRARLEADTKIARDRRQRTHDLAIQRMLDGFDAAARTASTSIDRADIEAQREYARAIAEGVDATEAAARADMVRARALDEVKANMADLLKSQNEQLARLRLEASLAGQTERIRNRILALYEAEIEIQRAGIDATSELAAQIRENAESISDWRTEVERSAEAWDKVRGAAEDAIDGPIDRLLDGDWRGALSSIAETFSELFTELAIKNPLKNDLLGTNYATWSDVGGFRGILAGLSGGSDLTSLQLGAAQAAAMTVTTPSVTLNTTSVSGLGLTSSQGSYGIGGALPGAADVQSQIWQFFTGKGLKPWQVAGVMGNISAESGFNPLAVGDGGDALGLFQHNDRAGALLSAIGGRDNLLDVQAQLEFAWQELLTTERVALQKLLESTNVEEATGAFLAFERPANYSASDPTRSMGWDSRLEAAEQSMAIFADTTSEASQGLMGLGAGFDSFGAALGGLLTGQASLQDVGRSLFGSLIGQVFGGMPGWSFGGATGGSDPSKVAGLVHEQEFVFNAAATARIGVPTLEAIQAGTFKGFKSGGATSELSSKLSPLMQNRAAAGGSSGDVSGNIGISITLADGLVASIVEQTGRQTVQVVQDSVEAYDRALPRRMQQISSDPRRHG